MIKAKKVDMQAVPPLPIPTKEEKRLVQAEVNQELFDAVEKEMKKRGLKIRDVLQWGLKAFLMSSNPKEASRLGISVETP